MIQLNNVSFSYSNQGPKVLDQVNLKIESGEFCLIVGPTGSGKSTLLKIINRLIPSFSSGQLTGSIEIDGQDCTTMKPQELAELIGFIPQQPEDSFVTETVKEEIAFGMEQLGFSTETMRARISRIAKEIGIEHLIESQITSLSGGEKQRVSIAAALAAGQKILLLDEPTSSLDSEAVGELIELLGRLPELGITVLVAEHRIDRLLGKADSLVLVSKDGSVIKTENQPERIDYRNQPPVVKLSKKFGWAPIETSLASAAAKWKLLSSEISITPAAGRSQSDLELQPLAEISNLTIQYEDRLVISELSFSLHRGEISALMGANGSGKTSTLLAIQGSGKKCSGKKSSGVITVSGVITADLNPKERIHKVAMVPQKARDLLFLNSLGAELAESDTSSNSPAGTTARIFESLVGSLDPLLHPRDLSSGQQVSLVLALQLVKDAPLILLDEPTTALDYEAKDELAAQLIKLRDQGKAILLATHDVEFVAQVCDRVLVIDQGSATQSGTPAEVLTPVSKYATTLGQITGIAGLFSVDQIRSKHAD